MEQNTFRYVRRVAVIGLLVFVVGIRFVPFGGEFYATYLYPSISRFLSWLGSLTEWSLEEITVLSAIVLLVGYPLLALLCGRCFGRMIKGELEMLAVFYSWFYLGWGCNYFRSGFHERLMIPHEQCDTLVFNRFLAAYTDSLNYAYLSTREIDKAQVRQEIKQIYATLPSGYGLTVPTPWQQPKRLLFNKLYSSVGVLGYMGPFFCETQLNEELPVVQYPFTYAHELSHLLGVSNEAEANFWAYQVCTHSDDPLIRYSGYLGIFSFVVGSAETILEPSLFRAWLTQIEPVVIEDRERLRNYWTTRYNPMVGEVQHTFYNLFLKGNKIATGTKNYAQVVEMLIAVEQSKCVPLRKEGTRLSVKQ